MHSWYNKLDLPTLLAWLGLITIGLVAIYSTTHGPAATYLLESVQRNFNRQMLWVSVSVIGLVIALFLPVRFFQQGAFIFYAISLLLLVAALLFGREVNGAKSWLPIGPVQVQVSELAKVGTVLAVARLLSLRRPDSNNVRYAVGAVGLLLAPAILIIMQNDTGTALIFLGLVPIMLFWSGLPVETVLLMVSPAIAGYFSIVSLPVALGFSILFCLFIYTRTGERYMVALAGLFTFGTLGAVNFALQSVFQDYQVARILSFTNPEAYSQGVGWHLVQSRAALSGGGLFGKGFMEGP
ncbi:MAG: FtsW/RodA/SpoVE family cell cycle protein, partial [Candidatus Wenzhouxiangella sp. M2_3B_020]